jgi:hypothetical protein
MPLASTSVLNVVMETCNAKAARFFVVAMRNSDVECNLPMNQAGFTNDCSPAASSSGLAFDKVTTNSS